MLKGRIPLSVRQWKGRSTPRSPLPALCCKEFGAMAAGSSTDPDDVAPAKNRFLNGPKKQELNVTRPMTVTVIN
jgi:hypothetical protein